MQQFVSLLPAKLPTVLFGGSEMAALMQRVDLS
jgi:hypothetical protein